MSTIPCAYVDRADSRFAPSLWEMASLCNDVSHWLGASLESALVDALVHLKICHTDTKYIIVKQTSIHIYHLQNTSYALCNWVCLWKLYIDKSHYIKFPILHSRKKPSKLTDGHETDKLVRFFFVSWRHCEQHNILICSILCQRFVHP